MLTTLMKLGLSEKESKVYLAALELGSATVQNIAKNAEVNRPTAYFILEKLIKLNLVSAVESGGKSLFSANSPKELSLILKRQQDKLKQDSKELDSILPQLGALFSSAKTKPNIRYFTGYEGQIAMRDEASGDVDKEIFSFVDLDNLRSAFPKYKEIQESRRVENKHKSNVIFTSSEGKGANDDDNEMLRVSRYVPKDKFPFGGSVTVHPKASKLYISIYKDEFLGIVIESPDISKMFFQIWKLGWEAAERYN